MKCRVEQESAGIPTGRKRGFMEKKILIVGTVPYNRQSTSRAFDAYFNGWPREKLAQIFSNTKTPCKGHCQKLYQITDQRMLKRWFGAQIATGKQFFYDELPDAWADNDLEVGSAAVSKLYNWGSHKSSFVYLARKLLWRKALWCTPELEQWLDDFQPECVFLAFSDDFFIPEIAMYVADRYQIPIISCIGDDYYFNYKFSLSPLYHCYKLMYRAKVRRVFSHRGTAAYIGDKIRDLYNANFPLEGETVYLSSEVAQKEFTPIDLESPNIAYFGNIRLGRNESLCQIATALGKINPDYRLQVYSNEADPRHYRMLQEHPNVDYRGSVPYSKVKELMAQCHLQIVAEGFSKKDVDITRYSLSTKVADALASGCAVFAYGSEQCGAIEYAAQTGCITTCTRPEQLQIQLQELLDDTQRQQENYRLAEEVTRQHHTLAVSTAIFRKLVDEVTQTKEQTP